MFRENTSHMEPELFGLRNTLPENLRKMYERSWSKLFYEQVFCNIDEKKFEPMYSAKASKPNFPVNIYVALEIIKEQFGISDEMLLNDFHFDTLTIMAVGLNSVGEKTMSPRTLYYNRERILTYEEEAGINLIEEVFKDIRDRYQRCFSISKEKKRIDSFQLGSNIRRLNRLKLFLEVLTRFLKELSDDEISKLGEEIEVLRDADPEKYVYKLSNQESRKEDVRIGEIMYRVKNYFASDDKIREYETYRQLVRVVDEQIKIKTEETGEIQIGLKDKKEVSSGSLQSPHDEDATYRKKGKKQSQGYGVTVAETCHEDNQLQLVTDVIVEPNNKDDAVVLLEHFEEIIEGGETKEIIGDGLYLTEDTEEKADKEQTKMVTTAIRGRKVDEEKLDSTDFHIEDGMVISCPAGKQPVCHESKNGVIKAIMAIDDCANCPLREQCPVRLSRKRYKLEFKPDRMRVDRQRQKFKDGDYLGECKLRPAVESTVFQFKCHVRNGKSRYRGMLKIKRGMLFRAISINFKRVHARIVKDILLLLEFLVKIFAKKHVLLYMKQLLTINKFAVS